MILLFDIFQNHWQLILCNYYIFIIGSKYKSAIEITEFKTILIIFDTNIKLFFNLSMDKSCILIVGKNKFILPDQTKSINSIIYNDCNYINNLMLQS